MAGLKVVPVKTHADGNLDLEDLRTKAEKHKDNLAAFMVRTTDAHYEQLLTSSVDHVPVYVRRLRAWCARCRNKEKESVKETKSKRNEIFWKKKRNERKK